MKILSSSLIVSMLKSFFEKRASQYPLEIVFLYGSYVSACPHKDSDIDLAILFSSEIDDPDRIFSLLTEITYELTQELKLNKEINIISIDRNFPYPMLYYNVIISGIPIFIKNHDEVLNLKLQAIHQMEDFQIFGVIWQREVTKKNMQELKNARI